MSPPFRHDANALIMYHRISVSRFIIIDDFHNDPSLPYLLADNIVETCAILSSMAWLTFDQ